MKCNRYFFSYTSTPVEVRDYISRLADVATHSYGPDALWSRLLQMLDNARCLGWRIPKFGQQNMPDFFRDLTEDGINHIFENQAKILIDIAPITTVLLEDFNINYPVRMVGTSTPAGDLIWKCHLLTDFKSGKPYVWDGQQRWVKTKGTKLVCSNDNIPYDENVLIEYMGGSQKGTWPVPFLPESFSDHPLASAFSIDGDVVELVAIEEPEPVKVLVTNRVPWYRPLYMDRSKALPLTRPKLTEKVFEQPIYRPETLDFSKAAISEAPVAWNGAFEKLAPKPAEDEEVADSDEDEGFENESENDESEEDGSEENGEETAANSELFDVEPVTYNNVIVNLSESEYQHLERLEDSLRNSGIASKKEAEKLRKKSLPNTPSVQKAEQWLLTNLKRKALLGNASFRIGALFSLLQRHSDQPVLVLHPKEKWALRLVDLMKSRGLNAVFYDKTKSAILKRFGRGEVPILVSSEPDIECFVENIVVISVSALNADWAEALNDTHTVYAISLRQLGFADANLIQEHPVINVEFEDYDGPGLPLLKGLDSQDPTPEPAQIKVEPAQVSALLNDLDDPDPNVTEASEVSTKENQVETTQETDASEDLSEKEEKPKRAKKEKADKGAKTFRVTTGKGRPTKTETLEEAMLVVTKKEEAGHVCQVLDPQDQVVYTTKTENSN